MTTAGKREREGDGSGASPLPLMLDIQRRLVARVAAAREEAAAAAEATAAPAAAAAVKYDAAFRALLDEAAALLLSRCEIRVTPAKAAPAAFRIVEVEMYSFAAGVYEDRFTHGTAAQQHAGAWYFHTQGAAGATYKAGSFKGLDITFGAPGVPCGALIRGLRDVATGALVEGPSLVVDRLLAAAGAPAIKDLVGASGVLTVAPDVAAAAPAGLSLAVNPAPDTLRLALLPAGGATTAPAILRAPRVGLVPRSREDLRYAGRLLRFADAAAPPAKQRAGVIAALLCSGGGGAMDAAAAAKTSGGTKKSAEQIAAVIAAVAASGGTIDEKTVLGGDVMKSEVIAAIVGWASVHNCL